MRLSFTSEIPASCKTLWRWHERPFALQRLLPKRVPLEVVSSPKVLEQGDNVSFCIKAFPGLRYHANFCLTKVCPKTTTFIDEQRKGPFHYWRHIHQMSPCGDPSSSKQTSLLTDKIHFRLTPFQSIDDFLKPFVKKQIKRAFALRHHITAWDTFWFENYPLKSPPIIFSFKKGHPLGKALHSFFAPLKRDQSEYHHYRQFRNEHKPQVVINALGGQLSERAKGAFTKRLCEINPSKCVVLYRGPAQYEKLSFIEHYCKYPVFFDCSSLIDLNKSPRSEIYAARFYQTWLSEEELFAAVWLSLYDYSYSDRCTLARSLKDIKQAPLYSSSRYSAIIDRRQFGWQDFVRLYS